MNSIDKRNSVKKDYDLIADLYCDEFGVNLEDVEFINKFKSMLNNDSKVIDLGGGSGKVTKYLLDNNIDAVCYDFSINMMNNAKRLFPDIKYILDDILNIKDNFKDNSVDGIIALYSLFHIPKENMSELFSNIKDVLKDNGVFAFSFQLGVGEDFVDEPYLNENGKNILYMNYYSKEEIYNLINSNFEVVYENEKREIGDNVLGEDGNDAIYVIVRKK